MACTVARHPPLRVWGKSHSSHVLWGQLPVAAHTACKMTAFALEKGIENRLLACGSNLALLFHMGQPY